MFFMSGVDKATLRSFVRKSNNIIDVAQRCKLEYLDADGKPIKKVMKALEKDMLGMCKMHFAKNAEFTHSEVFTEDSPHGTEVLVRHLGYSGDRLVDWVCGGCKGAKFGAAGNSRTSVLWNDARLQQRLYHKNENVKDCRPCNLYFLCPNCKEQRHPARDDAARERERLRLEYLARGNANKCRWCQNAYFLENFADGTFTWFGREILLGVDGRHGGTNGEQVCLACPNCMSQSDTRAAQKRRRDEAATDAWAASRRRV